MFRVSFSFIGPNNNWLHLCDPEEKEIRKKNGRNFSYKCEPLSERIQQTRKERDKKQVKA